jgi:hypothetical protein
LTTLDQDAIAQLKHINTRLDALQTHIYGIAKAYRSQITATAAHMSLPIDDIQIEAELDFFLSPTDPAYDATFEQSENRLAHRTMHTPESPDLLHFGINEPGSAIGPQSWLFHDLTEHDYGKHELAVALGDLLRVGDVHVELVVRQGMSVDFMGNGSGALL